MGNAAEHIKSITFSLMDDGVEPNKKRLNFAFKEGFSKDP